MGKIIFWSRVLPHRVVGAGIHYFLFLCVSCVWEYWRPGECVLMTWIVNFGDFW